MHTKLLERWNAISLRTKVTGVSVLLLTVGLLVAGLGSTAVLRGYLLNNVDQRVATALQSLNPDGFHFEPTLDGYICSYDSDTQVPSDYAVSFYDADGDYMCSNKPTSARPAIASMPLAYAASHSAPFTLSTQAGLEQWRIAAHRFTLSVDGDQYPVSAIVALSLDDTNKVVASFAAIFLFFGLTVVIVGAALTRLLVTTTFWPLRDVEATAARFAAGDFTQRLGGATPNTEVGRLNRSLNAMLNRIDQAFADRARTIDQMRRFVGDASHELRTPLVSVRGYAELYRMGALPTDEAVAQAMERIEKEAVRMGGLVEDLLELARLDEAKPLELADVDLVAIARDAALDAMAGSPGRLVSVVVADPPTAETDDAEATDEADAAAASVDPPSDADSPLTTGRVVLGAALARWRARRGRGSTTGENPVIRQLPPQPTSRVVVPAEERKLRQVVTNLMGNALRYTPDGSPIEIAVASDPLARTASIAVVDHGEGIAPQIREKIFQRFWRADTSRNRDTGGSGLGLAIVASIVQSHRGRIDVLETEGGGATFRVTLPLLPSPIAAPSSTEG
ncbi:HAMP domain-containing sensor histidine kinase [Galbitalea sp. SE-J8]|uniref:sensor histidine kinase n=1 Tax=Galbitalea sp. SE-J8 TaxID=3054952 RepID=UPI00259C70D6|nr:HAMP domain-containing sensor histidine kinase [Galbitalea sp. SE-J8]MDM4763737.1 HAMP domain-containing sensor histidine kinase [Galbitalea sp. SE-J8]